MRFVCDHNVDAAVAKALRQRGHDAWLAGAAGLALEEDDALTVYADEKGAALLTHDKEFSKRRKTRVVGQHVYLTCGEEDAAEVIGRYLSELLPLLERGRDIWIQLSTEGIVDSSHKWE